MFSELIQGRQVLTEVTLQGEVEAVSCEQLVCAYCAGPVIEGRCTSCRAARGELHHSPLPSAFQLLVALLVVLALFAALLAARGGL